MKKLLGRDVAIAPSARKTVTIDIDELECSVILQELSIAQLDSVTNDVVAQLSLMIVDENGNRLFITEEQMKQLSELSGKIATRLIKEAARLNGISDEEMETAIKNFAARKDSSASV